MTATPRQLANSSAFGAAVPTRSTRGSGSPAQLSPLRDRNGAQRAQEERRQCAGEGRRAIDRRDSKRDVATRASQDRLEFGKYPRSPSLRRG